MPLTEQKGVAESEALSSNTEEASKEKDHPNPQQAKQQPEATESADVSKNSAEVSKNYADVSKNSATVSSNSSKVTPRTHAIDPMTLSLIPLTKTKGSAAKSTSPVIEGNPASATPTSQGATPTSALDLVRMGFGGGGGSNSEGVAAASSSSGRATSGDLMSFSLSPAVVEEMLQPQGSKVTKGEHHLESSPFNADSASEDLIKFSLTPAQLGISSHAPTTSQARTGFGSKFQHSPILVPKASTTAPIPTGIMSHSHVNGATPPLKPEWEHFSDSVSKPTVVAPQKLIPPTTNGGVAKPGIHGNKEQGGKQQLAEIGKAWTMVTKVSGGSFSPPSTTETGGGGASPAVQQLKRIASQEEGVGQVGVVIGDFKLESVATTGETAQKSKNDNDSSSDRRFSPLPPMPDELEMPTLPFSSRGVAKSNADSAVQSTLLDDLEYAFPNADKLFADPLQGGGSKVKGKGDSGGRNFDYADIDLEMPHISRERGGAAVARVKVSPRDDRVEYAEIRTEDLLRHRPKPPGVGVSKGVVSRSGRGREEEEEYARLVDVTTEDTTNRRSGGGQPVGTDPLYAIPSKAKKPPPPSSSSSSSGVGVTRPRPHPQGGAAGVQRPPPPQRAVATTGGSPADTSSQANTGDVITSECTQ